MVEGDSRIHQYQSRIIRSNSSHSQPRAIPGDGADALKKQVPRSKKINRSNYETSKAFTDSITAKSNSQFNLNLANRLCAHIYWEPLLSSVNNIPGSTRKKHRDLIDEFADII